MAKYDYMVIDVGSTYTKQRLFKDCKLVAAVQSPTTIENVYEGIATGEAKIKKMLEIDSIDVEHVLATSSAAGGLRMVAMGYMSRVTAKAAKEVAMNSGAKVLEIISYDDPAEYRLQILNEINPDVILLAGGTDSGDEVSILENASLILRSGVKSTVVIAGNINAQKKVAEMFAEGGVSHVSVPNIMPTIHELRVKEARDAIHMEFIRQITKAPGLSALQQKITNKKIVPTPGAVLMASELLAKGTYQEQGLGGIVVIDLGGATTDVHSIMPELGELPDEERGLIVNNEKQVSYRTVEGNLGLRVSVSGIIDTVGSKAILMKANMDNKEAESDLIDYCERIGSDTKYIPQTWKEEIFDVVLAEAAIEVALKRHAGFKAEKYDSIMGIIPGMPIGRDLRKIKTVIGVGGIFSHRGESRRQEIMKNALKNPGISLLPESPTIITDSEYLLYAAGVIAQIDLDYAFKMLKNYFDF